MRNIARVELGFSGERFIYLPIPMINLMEDSPLTGDLYLYSMGFFSRASHHYINRPTGCDEFLFIYCKEGCGWSPNISPGHSPMLWVFPPWSSGNRISGCKKSL